MSTYPRKVERGIREVGPGRFQVRVYVGRDPRTNRPQHVSRTAANRTEAKRIRAQLEGDAQRGDLARPGATFAELLEEWLRFGEQEWASKTASEHRRKVERVILPLLGSTRLAKLNAHTLDRFYRELSDGIDPKRLDPKGLRVKRPGVSGKPMAPRTVLGYHRLISAALAQAVKWGYVPRNVAAMTSPPKVRSQALTIPTAEEVAEIIAKAERSSKLHEMATLLRFAAATGARRGEVCALTWGDVALMDPKGPEVTIRRAIGTYAGKTEIKGTKTHAERTIPIGAHLAEELRARLARATEQAAACDFEITDACYVFSPDLDGTTYLRPDTVSQAFHRLLAQLEKATGRPWPYRFHDLRHYAATAGLAAGFPAPDVARRLGHADATLVLSLYGHATAERSRALAEELDAGLF